MRAFIAIEIPDDVRLKVVGLISRLKSAGVLAVWVRPEQIHLTLRFFEAIEPEAAAALSADLRETLRLKPTFTLSVEGLGAFPDSRKPRVLWIGAHPSEGPLLEVQALCEASAQRVGIRAAPRSFRPHLTIGRIRDWRRAGPVEAAVKRESRFSGGTIAVERVTLFSSVLGAQGAQHTKLEEYPLWSQPHS